MFLQISSFLNIIEGKVLLPSKTQMYAELERDINERREITGDEKYYHLLDKHAENYCASLAEFAKVPPIKPVVFNMCFFGLKRGVEDFPNYRNNIYRIINDREYFFKE